MVDYEEDRSSLDHCGLPVRQREALDCRIRGSQDMDDRTKNGYRFHPPASEAGREALSPKLMLSPQHF